MSLQIEKEIERLQEKMVEEDSHTQRAFWKGWKNIYEDYKEKEIEDLEKWLDERRESAESLIDGRHLDAHMLASGEIEAIEELEAEVTSE